MNSAWLVLGSLLAAPPQVPADADPGDPPTFVAVPQSDSRWTPDSLTRHLLLRPAELGLNGRGVALPELLAETVDPQQRAGLINGYWKLSAAVAHYHVALMAHARLEDLADAVGGETEFERLEVQAALADAVVQVRQAELAAVEAQHQLARLQVQPAIDPLPLPSSLPHTGGYRTHYEEIFANRAAPVASELNDTLRIRHRALRARASAVSATSVLLRAARSLDGSEAAAAGKALTAHHQLVKQQSAFVAAVHDYNLKIAQYAQLVAPQGIDADRLVSMLIKTSAPPPESQPLTTSGPLTSVLKRDTPAAATAGATTPATGPATARPDGWKRSEVEQASAEEPIEP